MAKQRIPYSKSPEMTEAEALQHSLHWKIRDKEITLEQAKAQGYKEPEDDLFGMSQLMRDELD